MTRKRRHIPKGLHFKRPILKGKKTKRYSRLFRLFISSLIVAVISTVIHITYDYLKNRPDCQNENIQLTNNPSKKAIKVLQDLERNLNANTFYKDSLSKFETLEEYFIDANKEIRFALREIKYTAIKDSGGITLIYGPAGCGKSFIFKKIDTFIDTTKVNLITYSLKEKCSYDKLAKGFKNEAQLIDRQNEQNSSRMLPNNPDFGVNDIINDKKTKHHNSIINYVIIDDCDEWHPNTIKNIIKTIKEYASANPDGNWRFILLGRPEAFTSWLSYPGDGDLNKIIKQPVISPSFQTSGDLKFRIEEYFKSRKLPDNKDATYTKIINLINNSKPEDAKFIINTINDLQWGNYLIEYLSAEDSLTGISDIKKRLFTKYIDRNNEIHGQPSIPHKLYMMLLKQAAINCANYIKPNGHFRISSADFTEVKFCENGKYVTKSFNTKELLEFSGFIDIIPDSPNFPDYRFHPLWLHRYLIEVEIP